MHAISCAAVSTSLSPLLPSTAHIALPRCCFHTGPSPRTAFPIRRAEAAWSVPHALGRTSEPFVLQEEEAAQRKPTALHAPLSSESAGGSAARWLFRRSRTWRRGRGRQAPRTRKRRSVLRPPAAPAACGLLCSAVGVAQRRARLAEVDDQRTARKVDARGRRGRRARGLRRAPAFQKAGSGSRRAGGPGAA
eukprot:364555-Chlamydomonas_euryale.AAC.14